MMGIEKHLEKEKTKSSSDTQLVTAVKNNKGTRGDIDDEDDEESYYRCEYFYLILNKIANLIFNLRVTYPFQLHGRESNGWCR